MTGVLDEASHAVRGTGARIRQQAGTVKDKAGKRIRDVMPGHAETGRQRLRRVLVQHTAQGAEALVVAVTVVGTALRMRRARNREK